MGFRPNLNPPLDWFDPQTLVTRPSCLDHDPNNVTKHYELRIVTIARYWR